MNPGIHTAPADTSHHTLPADIIADADGELSPFDVLQRVGMLTRKLHDALNALGYNTKIEHAVGTLPDARARLDYIASLTGRAAEKVLSSAEDGRSVQQAIEADAGALAEGWKAGGTPDAALIERTREFLAVLPVQTARTREHFSDIILAQDFHDLAGQTIQRVVRVARDLEDQLVHLLLDATPPEQRADLDEGLAGPVIDPSKRDDVVANQAQVDDLLESLGF